MSLVDIETGEIVDARDVALVAADPSLLDTYNDPSSAVVAMCEQARWLLASAVESKNIDLLKNTKADATIIATLCRERDLGMEAASTADELVLRTTRSLGIVVRAGQEDGTVADRQHRGERRSLDNARGIIKPTPIEVFGHERTRGDAYVMAEADDDLFDAAIQQAKADKKLNRANVVRIVRSLLPANEPTEPGSDEEGEDVRVDKSRIAVELRVATVRDLAAKGNSSQQIALTIGLTPAGVRKLARNNSISIPADQIIGRSQAIDVDRIVDESIYALQGVASGLALIEDVSSLDAEKRRVWLDAITPSLAAINKFKKELNR